MANSIRSVLSDDSFRITNLRQSIAATKTAGDLILMLFNIVAFIGVIFSFFVLWLSFTANIRENSWGVGVLRAIGLEGRVVVLIYVYEALAIVLSCIIQGVVIGCFTAITLTLQFNLFTEMPFTFYLNIPITVSLLTMSVVVATLGSYLPAIEKSTKTSKLK